MSEAVTAPRRFVAPAPQPFIPVSPRPIGAPEESPAHGLGWVIPFVILSILAGIAAALVLGQ